MKLTEGCKLTYIVHHEAWYRQPGDKPSLGVQASYPDGGQDWGFQIVEYRFDSSAVAGKTKTPSAHVEIFEDAYRAFVQIPDFFTLLAEEAGEGHDGFLLEQARGILDRMGAVDTTARVSPYPPAQEVMDASRLRTILRDILLAYHRQHGADFVIENCGLCSDAWAKVERP